LLVSGSPFNARGLGGGVLVAARAGLAAATLAVVVAAGSQVVRFRRARGIERQQLRWVVLAAALTALVAPVFLVGLALGSPVLLDWMPADWVVAMPCTVGA